MNKNVLNTDLTGKVAVVTGAGGVLCSAFAAVLARAGAKVALLDLNYDAAKAYADEITAEGGIAKAYSCNVLDKDICYSVADQVLADLGPCDIQSPSSILMQAALASCSISTSSAHSSPHRHLPVRWLAVRAATSSTSPQ